MSGVEHSKNGWLGRWLCCWLGILAAGCSVPAGHPTATLLPLATLPGYASVSPTRTPVWRLRLTPTRAVLLIVSASPARATLLVPFSTPLPITLDSPTCYETVVGSLWCVGLIRNPLALALINIRIRVTLVNADGLALQTAEGSSSRDWLPAGETTPYGVLFTTPPPVGQSGPVAEVLNADPAPTGATFSVMPLTVETVQIDLNDTRYHVQAIIGNPGPHPAHLVAVITLLDAEDHVTGFRTVDNDTTLAAGATILLDVSGSALASGATHVLIAADGLPVN